MALINIKYKKVLSALTEKLLETIKNNNFVNIHIDMGILKVSHCIIPDDIVIDDNIMITQGNFELNIKLDNVHTFDIKQDCFENGYSIHCDDMNVYLDFNT